VMGENKSVTHFSATRDEGTPQPVTVEPVIEQEAAPEAEEAQPAKPKRSAAKSARTIAAKSRPSAL